ncbi:MAG TPA: choice-of-anchor Q domain-containing protein [bacterium]|nr:choice-of-anchor Q domain-containing protein [bacterium]
MRRRVWATATLAVFFVWAHHSPAHSATIQVIFSGDNAIDGADGTCSLAEAIISANEDDNTAEPTCTAGSGADLIELIDGTTGVDSACSSCGEGLAFPTISTEITIRGSNAFGKSTIQRAFDGEEVHFFFVNADGDLTVENLHFQGGKRTDERGGAIMAFGPLTVRDSLFTENQGAFLGGGALSGLEETVVENCVFEGNSAIDVPAADGGAILAQGPLTVRNSQFINNRSFDGESTQGHGGAIANQQFDPIEIESSYFTGNHATNGGAIAVIGPATLTVSDSNFNRNIAGELGGAIYNESEEDNRVTRSFFDDNEAVNGGAIHNADSAILTANTSVFTGNLATQNGGGVHNLGTFTSESSHYIDNSAALQGGALLHQGLALSLVGGQIRGNQAVEGAGLFNDGESVSLENSSIFENSGIRGGGIYALSDLDLNNAAVYSNLALGEGAGIYVNDSTVGATSVTFADNLAEDGGAAFVEGGTLSLLNVTVSLNSANELAGGILNDGGTVELENTILAGNLAPEGPNCGGDSLTSNGFTLLGDASGCTLSAGTGDLAGDPGLGSFNSLSAPGKAHIPLVAGSQALDAIEGDLCPETDQLGQSRKGNCDIGAVEGPAAATPSPSPTPAACGNGIFEIGEQCDDGNTASQDGCSATCRTESGFQCAGEPTVCTPILPPPPAAADSDGDGLPDSVEEEIGTDPHSADTDGDGLSDFIETVGGTAFEDDDLDGLINAVDNDSDNDGIPDNEEVEGDGGCSLNRGGASAGSASGFTALMAMLGLLLGVRQRRS